MKIEVVYCPTVDKSVIRSCAFQSGMTIADALAQSGIYNDYPEAQVLPVGVFAKAVTSNTVVKPGDRIEIYRPLCCDPKEARRKRVVKRK